MAWTYLVIAALFEIGWIYSLKSTAGFTRFLPLVPYALCGLGAAFFLSLTLRTLPVRISYSVWTGMAIAGSNIVAMLLGHEPVRLLSLFFIFLILSGVVGLRLCVPAP